MNSNQNKVCSRLCEVISVSLSVPVRLPKAHILGYLSAFVISRNRLSPGVNSLEYTVDNKKLLPELSISVRLISEEMSEPVKETILGWYIFPAKTSKQNVFLSAAFTGWETSNKYAIKNSMGQQVYFAAEESGTCMRQCCGADRGFVLHITDNAGQVGYSYNWIVFPYLLSIS